MAWERRGHRLYYYRKVRDGKRVVSSYCGVGPMAELLACADAEERRVRQQRRKTLKLTQDENRSIDQKIMRQAKVIEAVTSFYLLCSGFHKHRGAWRKRRGG